MTNDDGLGFWRGCLWAFPIAILMWAGIAYVAFKIIGRFM